MAYRLLLAIFAIFMLPFAGVFLSAKVREKLGTPGVIAGLIVLLVVIPVALAVTAPAWLESDYVRFTKKDQKYYASIAAACGSLLQQHTTFTRHSVTSPQNYFLWMDTNNVVWDDIVLSGQDSTLPEAIRSLHPYHVFIAQNNVGIWIGGPRPDYIIYWGKDEMRTNCWTLSCKGEGAGEDLYVEDR